MNAMTGAEMRCWREALCLSLSDLSRLLAVEERTINRWENEKSPIPRSVASEVTTLGKQIENALAGLKTALAGHPCNEDLLRYRDNDDFEAHEPALWDAGLTARLHGIAVWEEALRRNLRVAYFTPPAQSSTDPAG